MQSKLQSEAETRHLDIIDLGTFNDSFCLNKCRHGESLHSHEDYQPSCTQTCLPLEQYCDGKIDFTLEAFDHNDTKPHEFLVPITITNVTVDNILLFPDELYCASRLSPIFLASYFLSFICFCLSIAVAVKTRPIIHFLMRRRNKELKKKQPKEYHLPKE